MCSCGVRGASGVSWPSWGAIITITITRAPIPSLRCRLAVFTPKLNFALVPRTALLGCLRERCMRLVLLHRASRSLAIGWLTYPTLARLGAMHRHPPIMPREKSTSPSSHPMPWKWTWNNSTRRSETPTPSFRAKSSVGHLLVFCSVTQQCPGGVCTSKDLEMRQWGPCCPCSC
jgi:hypothetical protein